MIIQLTGVPFLFPAPLTLLALALAVLALGLVSVMLAAVGAMAIVTRRAIGGAPRPILVMMLLGALLALFVMTPASAFLWDALPIAALKCCTLRGPGPLAAILRAQKGESLSPSGQSYGSWQVTHRTMSMPTSPGHFLALSTRLPGPSPGSPQERTARRAPGSLFKEGSSNWPS